MTVARLPRLQVLLVRLADGHQKLCPEEARGLPGAGASTELAVDFGDDRGHAGHQGRQTIADVLRRAHLSQLAAGDAHDPHGARVDEALVGANVRRRVLPAQHDQVERWALKQPAQLQETRWQQTVRGQEAEDVVAQLGDHFII